MTDLITRKKHCRREAKEALGGLSEDHASRAASDIQARVMTEPEFMAADAVFLYMAFGKEISTKAVLERALSDEKRVFLPAFADGEYWAAEYVKGDRLVEGNYGILEPERGAECDLPDRLAILLPGLAFDRQCHRLGRGGGYYDRMLQRLSVAGVDILNIGLSYDCTLYESLPVGPLDFDVDIVVTEKESVRVARSTRDATE